MNDEDQEMLRAVFAGLAMNGLLRSDSPRPTDVSEHRTYEPDGSLKQSKHLSFARQIAIDAMVHADALLVALKETPNG